MAGIASPAFGRISAPVVVLYGAALLQGLTLVSFPALSAVLIQDVGLSNAQYGAIFLPQVAFVAAAAVLGGVLARRLGLKTLLVLALIGNASSQLLLALSAAVPEAAAYPVVLLGTAALGIGFGLFGAPLNSYPPIFFKAKKDAAVVAAHTLFGAGLAVGPQIGNPFVTANLWYGFPLLLLALCLIMAVAAVVVALPRDDGRVAEGGVGAPSAGPLRSPVFWSFVLIAVLYAFAEGTFSNWAVIYLSEVKALPDSVAGSALSIFWTAMVLGRLLVAALLVRLPGTPIWLAMPALMILAFLLMPLAETPALGVALFAFAGLACSAFFPLCITLVSQRFEEHTAWVSSMMIASLMTGVGLGTFLIGTLRDLFPLEQLYQISAVYPMAVLLLAGAVLMRERRRAVVETAE